jgi:hypothetical protein
MNSHIPRESGDPSRRRCDIGALGSIILPADEWIPAFAGNFE